MFKTNVLKVVTTFLFFLTAVNNAAGIENPPPPPMTLQLIYPPGKYDPGKRDNGMIRAELRNEGLVPITIPLGYDGVKTRLMSIEQERFPVVLRSNYEGNTHYKIIKIQPGKSQTIFELPLSEIFLQNGWADAKQWSWPWFAPPAGGPPQSPIHGGIGDALELTLREQGTLWAEIDIDGTQITSAKLTIPVIKLEFEKIEILAVCRSAKLMPDQENYVISFDLKTIQRGTLSKSERSFELYQHTTVHNGFLKKLPIRWRAYSYGEDFRPLHFGPHLVHLSFARLRDKQSGTTRLILLSYKLKPKKKPYRP